MTSSSNLSTHILYSIPFLYLASVSTYGNLPRLCRLRSRCHDRSATCRVCTCCCRSGTHSLSTGGTGGDTGADPRRNHRGSHHQSRIASAGGCSDGWHNGSHLGEEMIQMFCSKEMDWVG